MLIGMGNKKKQEAALPVPSAVPATTIFDVSTPEFEAKVVAASMEKPVLVDFWAPWCGPCKQLGPVLEQAVNDAGGKVLLAKINIDDNQELAQALRIQSVPTVYAFFQGQPVTAFAGAQPASQIKSLIDQLVKLSQQAKPGALDIPQALSQAAALLAANQPAEAQGLYAAVLEQDESNAPAYAGIVRTLLAADEIEAARGMIDHAPDAMKSDPAVAAARAAVELAEKRPDDKALAEFRRRLETNPDDHAARHDLAVALFAGGQKEAAIDALLEIIRRNRAWEDEKARLQLLQFFEALGPADPLTLSGRRKLSSILFS